MKQFKENAGQSNSKRENGVNKQHFYSKVDKWRIYLHKILNFLLKISTWKTHPHNISTLPNANSPNWMAQIFSRFVFFFIWAKGLFCLLKVYFVISFSLFAIRWFRWLLIGYWEFKSSAVVMRRERLNCHIIGFVSLRYYISCNISIDSPHAYKYRANIEWKRWARYRCGYRIRFSI